MDSVLFLAVLIVGLIIGLPIYALVRVRRLKKEAVTNDELARLVGRVYALEQAVAKLLRDRVATEASPPERSPAPSETKPPLVPATQPSAAPTSQVGRSIEEPRSHPVAIPPAAPPAEYKEPPAPKIPALVPTLRAGPSGTSAAPPRRWADLEERLASNWLNKIGTAAFVIGIALFLNYSMQHLGPAGKITVGYTLSAALLAAGVVGERKERYRIAGRAVLGGGWALAYFTTYALHNIPAARLIESPTTGFVLLFVVAAAMVAHSLRYHSQVTTGFAYLLAFASVAINEITAGSLVSSLLLAISLVLVLRGRRWYALEPFAIIATYSVHRLWLGQIFERLGGHKPFPEFKASVALLSAYWIVYLVSYFLRDDRGDQERRLLTASFLLNAAGYLAVLHYQSLYPQWRFWFLLVAGAIYLGVSYFSSHIGRRQGFILASTVGVALVVAAIPYRYSGARLELLWLVEAEAMLAVGWRLADSHLRKLGWLASGALSTYVLFHDLSPRFAVWRLPDARLGWLLVALAAAFYANGRLAIRFRDQANETDDAAGMVSPAVATGFLLAAAWVALPFMWTALAWTVIGIALLEIAKPLKDRMLWRCAHGAAPLAALRFLFINLQSPVLFHGWSLRMLTVGAGATLLYVVSRRLGIALDENKTHEGRFDSFAGLRTVFGRVGGLPGVYAATGTLLVTLLLWHEATNAAVALAWGLFGLALAEAGQALPDRPLRAQGHVVLTLSFARIFFADLNTTTRIGPVSARLITVLLLAVVYYFAANQASDSPRRRTAFLWFGTAALAALGRFELSAPWVAVAWSGLAVVLYFLGNRLALGTFLHQAYALTLLAGARCAFDNFYQTRPLWFTNERTVTVVAASLAFYLLFIVSWQKKGGRKPPAAADEIATGKLRRFRALVNFLDAYPQHLFFFVPTILLTVLLSLEARRSYLTAAWGVEGLIVFLAVFKLEERAYRWFSLILFLLCVGRILVVDVWTFDALGRIVSFIALGGVLLLVSFFYARHREILRRVL